MNPVTKFFLFLSKTDRHVITYCTDVAVKTQVAYGVFVFLTGAFAFLSCMYAVNMTFKSLYVAVPVALLYSTVIVFIDREIVSATKKVATLPRIALAIVIGMVISVPLEMRLFQNRIDQERDRLHKDENRPAREQMGRERQAFQNRINVLEDEIKTYRQNIVEAGLAKQDETTGSVREGRNRTGRAGQGPAFEAAEEQRRLNESLLQQAQVNLDALNKSEKDVEERIKTTYELHEVDQVEDLLANYEALEIVKMKSPATRKMALGLMLLIIMIEVIPALMKLLQQDNEYGAILEALRRRNITRVFAITNDHIDQVITSPHISPVPTLFQQLEQDPLTK
jgi:hypothetical protein